MRTALFLFAALAMAQDQTGGLRGTVIDAITHQPIKKATVTLNASRPIVINGRLDGPNRTAVTDASGAFLFDSLPAGNYNISAQHPSYPQRQPSRKTADVTAGDIAGPVTLELTPGASVTGHVLDEDGDPLTGCSVQPHPSQRPEQTLMFVESPPNENGEYRLFGMPPGKYIFSAQCYQTPFQPRPFSAGPDPPPSLAYPLQYYPLATDAPSAETLELAGGAEASGVDFRMKPSSITQVRGSFSPSGADWHGQPITIQLVAADPSVHRMSGARMNPEKGTFEFRQVFPGSYYLAAFTNAGPEQRIGAMEHIEVKDQPVETVLELKHGVDLNGSLEVEGNSSANPIPLNQFSVQLYSQELPMMGRAGMQVHEDGAFTIDGVLPGRYRLFVNGPSSFLKSAWLGSTEMTGGAFDLPSGVPGQLRVVMSTDTATITGTAPPGRIVFASRIDDNMMAGRRGETADASGRFKITGLAPGKYRIAAALPGDPFSEDGGQEISIGEGETANVDLKPAQ